MTIPQVRDLTFSILDARGNEVRILIGLYKTPGALTAWSIWMSVPTPAGGWKKMVQYPLTAGQFRSYDEDQAKDFLKRFITVVNDVLARLYGNQVPVELPDDDPNTESREEFWVRMLDELLTVRANKVVVKE